MLFYCNHTQKLKPTEITIHDLLEGEEVYMVEQILKHRRRECGYQYYVLWEGYPITEASWESESAFSTDGDTLSNYKEQHQLP